MAAEDPALLEIRALLWPMRAKPIDGLSPRGATPAFTDVKHKLRDWIEGRLHEFRDEEDVRAFEHGLNGQIRNAKLSCAWDAVPPEKDCPARGIVLPSRFIQARPTCQCSGRFSQWTVFVYCPPSKFSFLCIRSGCTEKDPGADEPRTLFPVHRQQRW